MEEIKKQVQELDREHHPERFDEFVREVKKLVGEREAYYDLEPTKEDIDAALSEVLNAEVPTSPSTSHYSESSPTARRAPSIHRHAVSEYEFYENEYEDIASTPPRIVGSGEPSNLFDRTQMMSFALADSPLTELARSTDSTLSPDTDEASLFAEEATRIFEDVPEMDYSYEYPVDPFLKEFEMKYWNDNVDDTVQAYNTNLLVHPTSSDFD